MGLGWFGFFFYFFLDICHKYLYVVVFGMGLFLVLFVCLFVSHFAHSPGSELDTAQSEVGCIVRFAEWPTKEQQSNSVIVSVP